MSDKIGGCETVVVPSSSEKFLCNIMMIPTCNCLYTSGSASCHIFEHLHSESVTRLSSTQASSLSQLGDRVRLDLSPINTIDGTNCHRQRLDINDITIEDVPGQISVILMVHSSSEPMFGPVNQEGHLERFAKNVRQ